MSRVKPEIFPYSTDAISAAFTRACKIWELKIYDFMISGTRGFRVCLRGENYNSPGGGCSGYRSWTSLKRYTHIRQNSDKYDNWK